MTYRSGSPSLLRDVLKGQARFLVPGIALRANHQVMEALVTVVIGQVIDQAVETHDTTALLMWMVVLAVNFVVLSGSYFFGERLLERGALSAEHEVRVALIDRVLAPTGGAETGRLPGELLSIATSDARRVSSIAYVAAESVGAFAALLVATFVLLRISLPLGLLVLVGSLPLLGLIELLGRVVQRHSDAEQETAARASGLADDFVSGLRVLKGFGGTTEAVQRYRVASRGSLDATLRAAVTQSVYQGVSLLLTGAFLALVALVGAHLAADGEISIGNLIAALGLSQFLIGPMHRLAYAGSGLAVSRASAARVDAILTASDAVVDGSAVLPGDRVPSLRLEEVVHGAARGVTLEAHAGEVVGIVSADPAFGSTLASCLMREVDPVTGRITLDGIPLSDLTLSEVRQHLMVLQHNSYLFSGSVLDTTRQAAEEGRLEEVLAASALKDVISALPNGVDSQISERGRSLSGGQRQRLSLAQSLAARASILVLEEPTTAVDSVTESQIASGLRDVRQGLTTVFITTSPTLLAVTDRVVLIDAGRVACEGTHDRLVREEPRYREIVFA